MKAIDLLRHQIGTSKDLTVGLLADMVDAPLVTPTDRGGNHPTWIAGHLAYAEANLVQHMLLNKENPLIQWKSLFGKGSQPTTNAEDYPPLANLLARWDEVRWETLQVLDTLSDEDLDKPACNPPPGRGAYFGTFGKVLTMVAHHPLMHHGQVADARRAAGRESLSG